MRARGIGARGDRPRSRTRRRRRRSSRSTTRSTPTFGADAKRFVASATIARQPEVRHFVLYGADGKLRPEIQGVFPDDRPRADGRPAQGQPFDRRRPRVAGGVKANMSEYQFDGVTARSFRAAAADKGDQRQDAQRAVLMAIFAVGIMVAVLFVIFRARWRLLSLPAVLVGCVSAFGLMGFVGIPLTMVTISGLPILIGLGVDFAIQLHSRIEEETFAAGFGRGRARAALARAGPALARGRLAACIGFMVLHLSDVPMIRDFGSMLAVGAVIVFMTSLTLISGVIYLRERSVGRVEPRARGSRWSASSSGLTARTVGRLAPIAAVALLVSLGGLTSAARSRRRAIPRSSCRRTAPCWPICTTCVTSTGSTNELNLLVETLEGQHVTDQAVWTGCSRSRSGRRRSTARHPQSNSLASFTKSVTGDTPTRASAEQALGVAPAALGDSVVNADRTMACDHVRARAISSTLSTTAHAHQRDRARCTAARGRDGRARRHQRGRERDGRRDQRQPRPDVVRRARRHLRDTGRRLPNPVKAVLRCSPWSSRWALPPCCSIGGVEYSPLTSISGPLIIAMGTEFNVLLMSRYFEERARARTPARRWRRRRCESGGPSRRRG